MMHTEQRQRTQHYLSSKGIDQALFANLFTTRWLTGFVPPIQLGPSFFAGGPPLVWYDAGHFTLVVLDSQDAVLDSFATQPGCSVVRYIGYTIDQPINGTGNLIEALRQILGQSHLDGKRIGVEMNDLPVALWN